MNDTYYMMNEIILNQRHLNGNKILMYTHCVWTAISLQKIRSQIYFL